MTATNRLMSSTLCEYPVPRHARYVPTHRGARHKRATTSPIRTPLVLSGVAVAVTGLVVSSGLLSTGDGTGDAEAAAPASSQRGLRDHDKSIRARAGTDLGDQGDLDRRSLTASRSDRRTTVDTVKKSVLNQDSGGQLTETEDLTSQDPRTIARAVLPEFGYGSDQFSCLDALYERESGWNVHADNPSSSAYGIPQALPGSKMATAGPDWADSAVTQIRWGLGYIKGRYGSPCGALGFHDGHGWY